MALALSIVSSVTCVLGADSIVAESACCAEMHHDCDAARVEQDCCAFDEATLAGPPSRPTPPAAPQVFAAVAQPTFADAAVPNITPFAFAASALKPSARPTYLLLSVFRL